MPPAARPTPVTPGRKLVLAGTALAYVAAAAALYAYIDDQALRAALSLPALLVAAMLGLSLASYALRALRWLLLSRSLGLRVSPMVNLVIYFAGYSLTPTPGKAGEAIRLWLLRRSYGLSYLRSVPLMLADLLLDLWAVLLLAVVCMWGFAQYRWQGLLLGGLVVAVSLPFLYAHRFARLLNGIYRRAHRAARILVRLRQVMRTMGELSNPETVGLTLAPTLLAWLALGAAFYLLLEHLGAPISFLGAVFVFSFSTLVGTASMLPGGLGSTEASLILLLRALGTELDVALAATAVIRLTTLWFAVAIGVALLPLAMKLAGRARLQT